MESSAKGSERMGGWKDQKRGRHAAADEGVVHACAHWDLLIAD